MANDIPGAVPAFDAERFCRRFLRQHHNDLLGLRYFSAGDDWVELAMTASPALAGSGETIHQGAVTALLDMAGTVAIWVMIGRWRPHATIDLRLDMVGDATVGMELRGRARCHAILGDIAFVEGVARSESGDGIARLAATYKFTDAR